MKNLALSPGQSIASQKRIVAENDRATSGARVKTSLATLRLQRLGERNLVQTKFPGRADHKKSGIAVDRHGCTMNCFCEFAG
jgi:hypothetical protein